MLPMKKTALTVLATLFFSLTSTPSLAAKTIESCNNKMADPVEYSRCLDGVIDVVERELQTWVNNQIFILEELAINTG